MRIALTALVAAILAGLAGVGLYSASQPAAQKIEAPLVNYGSQP
jgi:hypothetical protein